MGIQIKKHSMHIKQFVKRNKDHLSGLYTLQGLRYFVDTGYTLDFPQPFYQPLTINDRTKILRRLKNFINTYSINLVDVPEYDNMSFSVISVKQKSIKTYKKRQT